MAPGSPDRFLIAALRRIEKLEDKVKELEGRIKALELRMDNIGRSKAHY